MLLLNLLLRRLKLTLQDHRLKCKQLEDELFKMRTAIETLSEIVDTELNQDFQTIFSGRDKTDVPNFMKLFWEEQQQYIQSSCSSSIRYNPMIITSCINLAAKSSSEYSDLRYDSKTDSGLLFLSSLWILRDYKNYIRPTRGINPAVIGHLVWDKYSGELIGFVDLGDINTNYAVLKYVEKLATFTCYLGISCSKYC